MKKNITLSVDEEDLRKLRELAGKRKTTVNALVRNLILTEIGEGNNRSMEEFFRVADELNIDSGGYKWKREDGYDRKVLR
jgi:hypothetical protein